MAINSTNAVSNSSPIQVYISTPGTDPETNEPYKTMPEGDYTLSFAMNGLFNSYSLILKDFFTGKSQKLEPGATYNFTANRGNPGSVAADRFTIITSEKEGLFDDTDAITSGDNFNGVFPNPTSGVVTIKVKLNAESTAQILDNVGRAVGAINLDRTSDGYYSGEYDFGNHSSGIYFVRIVNSSLVFKVIRK